MQSNFTSFRVVLTMLLVLGAVQCSAPSTRDAAVQQPQYCEGGIGLVDEFGNCVSTGSGWPCVYVSVSDAITRRPISDAEVWIERALPMGDVGIAPQQRLQHWIVNANPNEEYFITAGSNVDNWCSGAYFLTVSRDGYQTQRHMYFGRGDRPVGTREAADRYDFLLSR